MFDLNSLLKLLTHFSEGVLPIDAEALSFGVHPRMQRYISIGVRSSQWPVTDQMWTHRPDELFPLHLRYEQKRLMKWTDQHEEVKWSSEGAIEAPKRQ